MARIDLKNKSIQAKLVYYGPGLCGKTTNLQWINRHVEGGQELTSLATDGDMTIFFDFMPIDVGKLRGMDVQFKLYTVPGQVRYNQTRKMVLKNVDGVVFVADSQEQMMASNGESFDNLFTNLAELGMSPEDLVILLQYNKRDLPTALPKEQLDAALNRNNYPALLASAYTGEGVFETLREACRLVIRRLSAQLPETPQSSTTMKAAEPVSSGAMQVAQAASSGAMKAASSGKVKAEPPAKPPPPVSGAMRAAAPVAAPPVEVQSSPAATRNGGGASAAQAAVVRPITAPASSVASVAQVAESRPKLELALEQSTRALAELKRELQSLRAEHVQALQMVASKTELQAVRERLEAFPTKAEVTATTHAIDKMTEGLKALDDGNGTHFKALRSQMGELAKDVARFSDRHSADSWDNSQTSPRTDVSALLQRFDALPVKADLQPFAQLRTELAALAERLSTLPTKADLETKTELAALAERLSALPTRGDLDGLRANTMAELSASQGVLEAQLAGLAQRLGELPTKTDLESVRSSTTVEPGASQGALEAQLAGLARRLEELPSTAELRALRQGTPGEASSTTEILGALKALAATLADKLSELPSRADVETLLASIAVLPSSQQVAHPPIAATPPSETDTRAQAAQVEIASAESVADTQSAAEPVPAEVQAVVPVQESAPEESAPEESAPEESAPEAAESAPEPAAAAAAPAEAEPAVDPPGSPEQQAPAELAVDAETAGGSQTAATAPQPSQPENPEVDEYADDKQHQNAARVARVMMADLYLYNKEQVDTGIRSGDFHERNKEAIADMRITYESRIEPEVRAIRDYLTLAIDAFIKKKRKQFGLDEA